MRPTQKILLLLLLLIILLHSPTTGNAQTGTPYNFAGEISNPNETLPAGSYGNLTGDGSYGWQTGTSGKDLQTNGFTFTLDSGNGNALDYSGVIYGAGKVTLRAAPAHSVEYAHVPIVLSGVRAQQYSGVTTMLQGVVELAKPAGVTAIPGDLVMQNQGYNDELRWAHSHQIADQANLTILSTAGKLNLNRFQEIIDGLSLVARAVITGSTGGQLTVTHLLYNGESQPAGTYTAANAAFVQGAVRLVVLQSPYDFAGEITEPNATIPAGSYGNLIGDGSYGWQTGTSSTDLQTNGFTFTLDSGNGNALNYSGVIYGTGNVNIKAGNANSGCCPLVPIVLSGVRGQQYSGVTTMLQGVVELAKPAGVTAIPGDLVMEEQGANDELRWAASHQIADQANLTIRSTTGKLNLNRFQETIHDLALAVGAVITGSTGGQLTVTHLLYNRDSQPAGVYTATNAAFVQGAARLVVIGDKPTPTPTPTVTSAATPPPMPTMTATPTATPIPASDTHPVVLVYAVLDNNLGNQDSGSNWNRLINNLEKGIHEGVHVRLLIDGAGPENSYVYDLIHDENPFCPSTSDMRCGQRYNNNRRKVWSEDTAHPQSLYEFIQQGLSAYPTASKTILVLVGHGSGWSANGLPTQPTGWGEQAGERIGGLLWDDTPGGPTSGSRSLSTKALGAALAWATADPYRPLDLLYLDACSMGMAEVAYELRNSAHYLLASPNTDWATFAYNDLLPLVNADGDGLSLGKAWLDREARVLHDGRYPFTLALLDLKQMGQLSTTVSTLSAALDAAWPAQRDLITTANAQSERYESAYDGAITLADSYVDLASFGQQLSARFAAGSPVNVAVTAVQGAVAQVVAAKAVESGSPWTHPEQIWQWQNAGGLAIYLPAQAEAAKRALYTADHLAWAQKSMWDEFLETYWKAQTSKANLADAELPTCDSTTACKTVLANLLPLRSTDSQTSIFLPLIQR